MADVFVAMKWLKRSGGAQARGRGLTGAELDQAVAAMAITHPRTERGGFYVEYAP
ncbi:MAG: hypothetical protein LC798_11105 [Chloroflexi bacterium]|nr:hypothetical protein [Chloroflexota bacterium]